MQVTNAKLFPRLNHEDTVPRNLLAAIEQHLALAAGLFHRLTYLLAHYKQKIIIERVFMRRMDILIDERAVHRHSAALSPARVLADITLTILGGAYAAR
jgi:hypothetical protein